MLLPTDSVEQGITDNNIDSNVVYMIRENFSHHTIDFNVLSWWQRVGGLMKAVVGPNADTTDSCMTVRYDIFKYHKWILMILLW